MTVGERRDYFTSRLMCRCMAGTVVHLFTYLFISNMYHWDTFPGDYMYVCVWVHSR